jgi:hypothetical protein
MKKLYHVRQKNIIKISKYQMIYKHILIARIIAAGQAAVCAVSAAVDKGCAAAIR